MKKEYFSPEFELKLVMLKDVLVVSVPQPQEEEPLPSGVVGGGDGEPDF